MTKITGIFILTMGVLLSACTTTTTTEPLKPVSPNPAVAKSPIVKSTSYDTTSSNYNTQDISAYYPTGVGINVNGYGPATANYYEAGFFGNF